MRQIVAKLEGATLISRRVHPEHGRILETYLMERGEALVSRSHQVVEDIEERIVAGFDRTSASASWRRCTVSSMV
jgi:DNA-binding MarR family transcriptional regulator